MSAYKPHARVAHHRSRRIDEVDGVPTTHTEPDWHLDWELLEEASSTPPLPFSDNKGVPAVIAVPLMLAVTLSSVVTSLAMLTTGHRLQVWIVAGGTGALGLFGLALAIPALAKTAADRRRERTER